MMREMEVGYTAPSARERRSRRPGRQGLPMEFFGVLYFCLVVLAGGLLVWQPARVAQMNERIAKLEVSLQDLRMQSESLKKQVSAIESLDYVEKEAKTRLGMVSPSEVRTFAVNESSQGDPSLQLASASSQASQDEVRTGGIFSLISRIAEIFGTKEATAKGQR